MKTFAPKPSFFPRLWIALGLLACFALFQNATLEERMGEMKKAHEINEQSKKRNAVLPSDFKGRSPQAVGQALIDHNFGDQFSEMEHAFEKFATWGNETELNGSLDAAQNKGSQKKDGLRFKAGLIGKSNLGIQMSQDYRLRCSYSPQEQSVEVAYDHPLNSRTNLTVKLKGEGEQSAIGLTYKW